MVSKCTFSVILPAYNAEKFISNAIKSVKYQDFQDWELLIVENGSTDRTKQVASEFLSDSRIHLFSSAKGVSVARNFGLNKAEGEYILFLDADDVLVNHALSACYKLIKEQKADFISCRYVEGRKKLSGKVIDYSKKNRDYLVSCLVQPTKRCNVTGVTFKRNIINNNLIRFDTNLSHAEDSVFLIKFLKFANIILDYDYAIYKVNINPDSTTRSGSISLTGKYIKAINAVKNELDLQNQTICNAFYAFCLNQLLIIFVHDIFYSDGNFYSQIKRAKKTCELSEFTKPIHKINLSNLTIRDKILFLLMKIKQYYILGIAAKYRRRKMEKNV